MSQKELDDILIIVCNDAKLNYRFECKVVKCDAGCGADISYPLDAPDRPAKICLKCMDWVAYPMGRA